MSTKKSRLGLYNFFKRAVVDAEMKWLAIDAFAYDLTLVKEMFGESVGISDNGYASVVDEKLFLSKLMTALTGVKTNVV